MIRETLTLLGAVAIVGIATSIAVVVIKKSRAPKGKLGDYFYHVAPVGQGNDGRTRYLAAIAPYAGDEPLSFETLGRGFLSLDEAKTAALDAIKKAGGTAREFVS